MVRGAFRVWEDVLVVTGGLLGILFYMLDSFSVIEMSSKLLFVCFFIMAAALFPRPIWLAVNWKRLNIHEPFSGVISASNLLPYRNGFKRITTLTFIDKDGEQIEKTFFGGVLLMPIKADEPCEVLYNESYPDEFVIMPAGQANAVTFAAVGVIVEIALAMWLAA